MVVVSVSLALWICVVWWQDKRTAKDPMVSQYLEEKTAESQIEQA